MYSILFASVKDVKVKWSIFFMNKIIYFVVLFREKRLGKEKSGKIRSVTLPCRN